MLKHEDRFDAIEIKSAQTYNSEFEKGLKKWSRKHLKIV